MKKSITIVFVLTLLAAGITFAASEDKTFQQDFDVSKCNWSSIGKNDYFILEPGYQQVLDGREDNEQVRLVITVLNDTKKVNGVETRVVEERETHDGELEEISRNYFAVCSPTNDVYYFGESVDSYEDGKVEDHEGSWEAGVGNAKPGLFMPSNPQLGDRFYQEFAPKLAMDRVEILSKIISLKTPAGEFHDGVKTEETTPLEPRAKEYKVYAKGIGVIQDGDLLLTKYGTGVAKENH